MRRLVAAFIILAGCCAWSSFSQAAEPVDTACVEVSTGDGWYAVARSIAPDWWATATQAQKDAFAGYLANANGVAGPSAALYAGELVCFNPDRVPEAPPSSSTTTSSTTSTTVTTLPATTTTEPATTTTVAPSTTSSPASTSTTVPSTTSTVPPPACSGVAGTPGSNDGQGGCFPGPGTVGIPVGVTLTPYSGPCTITTAGITLDARDFTGCRNGVDVAANGVTISRSHIYNSVHGREANGFAFTISDSLIDGALPAFGGVACVNCGVDGWNTTVLRTEIVHTNRGIYCMNHCVVRDSWIHGTNLDTSPCPQASSGTCPHASGIRVEQYATLIHNTVACDFTGPFNDDLGCSADISGYPDFDPIHDNTLTNNLFRANPIGTGFCVYGGATGGKPESSNPLNATNVRFVDNVFERGSNGRCGTYGPVTDFSSTRTGNVWSNNRWSDGGAVSPA